MSYEHDLKAFESTFRGNVITPDSKLYHDACVRWNTSFTNKPDLILQCRGASDAEEAVRFAAKYYDGEGENTSRGLTAVCAGGHSLSGSSSNVGGVMIDMSMNREVVFDPVSQTAYIGSGARLRDIDLELISHGVATPVGMVSNTGYCGLALGGGVGTLTRNHGLALDNFVEVHVVTADGKLKRCSALQYPDLFWAMRGGGHNMGVVVGFRVKTHPTPKLAEVGMIMFQPEALEEVLPFMDIQEQSNHKRLYSFLQLAAFPPSNELRCTVFYWYSGFDDGVVEKATKELTDSVSAKPISKPRVYKTPYPAMQSMFDGNLAAPAPFYGCSRWFNKPLGKSFAHELRKSVLEMPKTGHILLYWFGEGMREPTPDSTAFAHRTTRGMIDCMTRLAFGVDVHAARAWTRKAFDEYMVEHIDPAEYLNCRLADDEIPADVERNARDFGGNMDRLIEIKKKYDPDNLFRKNENLLSRTKAKL